MDIELHFHDSEFTLFEPHVGSGTPPSEQSNEETNEEQSSSEDESADQSENNAELSEEKGNKLGAVIGLIALLVIVYFIRRMRQSDSTDISDEIGTEEEDD
ncbi:MAG: hypothetical protein ABEI86_03210 [Halobacteriaceae archaeon]